MKLKKKKGRLAGDFETNYNKKRGYKKHYKKLLMIQKILNINKRRLHYSC